MMGPVTAAFEGSALLANAGRLGVLAVPALLGVAMVKARQIRDVPAAIGAFNAYTLLLGFPALIAVGVLDVDPSVASSWAFWGVIPIVDLLLVAVSWGFGATLSGRQGGSIALVLLFGNTAYLGLPFAVSVLGERARGPASLLVAVQVTIAVLLGPVLLQRWSGEGRGSVDWARIVRQPLLLAPFLAFAVRFLPAGIVDGIREVLAPLAASTAPVAMFLVGLYVVEHWDRVRVAERGVWTHVVLRMLLAPAVNAAVALILFEVGALSSLAFAVVVILGGMPAAISTFSIAYDEGVAADRVAGVVVRSTFAAFLTTPLLATVAAVISRR